MSGRFFREMLSQIDKKGQEKTLLVFLFYFFVIFSYYLIKPSKDSLFIHYVGAKYLSTAHIIIPIVTLLFIFPYDYLVRKLNRKLFGSVLMGFYILNILTIWLIFKVGWKREASYFLYIWSDIFSVSSVTLFWSITNDIYTSEDAKRAYGFLGMGSVLGGCLGSIVTEEIVKRIETENLFLVPSLFFILIIFLIHKIDTIAQKETSVMVRDSEKSFAKPSGKDVSEIFKNFLLVMRSSYLLFFTLLVFLTITCSKLVDYQIGRVLEISITDKNLKTEFMGNLYFWANLISFIILIFSSFFHSHLGIFGTLHIAPIVNLVTLMGFTIFPVLPYITITKILDGSIKYGITQVTREMLYIPTTKEEKYRAKAVIDILFYRLASVFSAILQIIFTFWIVLNVRQFNIIIFLVLIGMLWVLHRLKIVFIRRLEDKIDKIYEDNADILPGIEDKGENLSETFNEYKILHTLAGIIRKNASSETDNINPIDAIENELPRIAHVGIYNYHNTHITKAILILSRMNRESATYSLCINYLHIKLPLKIRKYYTILLSQNTPFKKVLAIEKSLKIVGE